jgi:peptidoglycan/LPS O-acetylase OafA/YrhL
MTIFVQASLPHLQAAGMPRLIQYGVFCLWTLFVIVPFSLAVYLLIEKPGIHLGAILYRKLRKHEKGHRMIPVETVALERPLESAIASQNRLKDLA